MTFRDKFPKIQEKERKLFPLVRNQYRIVLISKRLTNHFIKQNIASIFEVQQFQWWLQFSLIMHGKSQKKRNEYSSNLAQSELFLVNTFQRKRRLNGFGRINFWNKIEEKQEEEKPNSFNTHVISPPRSHTRTKQKRSLVRTSSLSHTFSVTVFKHHEKLGASIWDKTSCLQGFLRVRQHLALCEAVRTTGIYHRQDVVGKSRPQLRTLVGQSEDRLTFVVLGH